MDVTRTDSEVLKVFLALACEVFFESILQSDRQSDDAVPAALAIVDGDGALRDG
jgi:hypothetical protein